MKTEQATAPSLEDFKRLSREEFAFVSSFGFRETPPPAGRYQNPYEVHFQKDGWRIVVGGFSYGFSADVDIRSPDGKSASLGHLVPEEFWREHRPSYARGQQGDIGYRALCLKVFGQSFLRGEWQAFEELIRRQDAWLVANRAAQERSEIERKMERAIQDADVAFRAAHYADTIARLSPFEGFLPPAQIKKLALARKRANG